MCTEHGRQCFGCPKADVCEDLSDWLARQAELEGIADGQEVSADFWLRYEDCPFDKRCIECPDALHCPLLFFFREMLAGRMSVDTPAPPVPADNQKPCTKNDCLCLGCRKADVCEKLSDWLATAAEIEGVKERRADSENFWFCHDECISDNRCAECAFALHCKPLFTHSETLARRKAVPVYEMLPAPKPSLFDRLIDFIQFLRRLLR